MYGGVLTRAHLVEIEPWQLRVLPQHVDGQRLQTHRLHARVRAQRDRHSGWRCQRLSPNVPDRLVPVKGFTVRNRCSVSNRYPPGPYDELDIGLQRVPGSEGGGWKGVDVAYAVGGSRYVVTLAYGLYTCGTSVPRKLCGQGPSSSPTAG